MSRRIGLLLIVLSCACVLPSNAQSVVASITIPNNPEGIAVNPANNRIYVSIGGPSVVVIDGATNTVIDTISVSQGTGFIAANLVTGRVYAAGCNSSQTPACGVTVIDGTSNAIISTIPVAGTSGIGVQGIAVDPVTNRIYVADDDNYQVEVIELLECRVAT
jgi:YVTN family beta-propeller protein